MKMLVPAVLMAALATQAHAEMTLTSADFADGGTLPTAQVADIFGCTGGNISPQLTWSGAPEGTQGYAIMAYDPDAPTGSGWWHWTLFNIPADVTSLEAGAVPEAATEGRTDFGTLGYGGACPPEGDDPHRYIFTVYALGTDALPLDETAPGAMTGFFVRANALDQASVTATYGR